MLVFVDESGDPGLKFGQGSSEFFVLTLVIFHKNDEAHACDTAINIIRQELNLNPLSEFKFNKLRDQSRRHFLQAIANHKFVYYSIVVNKAKLTGAGFKFKEPFYKYVCSLAFNNCKKYLNVALIIIDGSGSREFRQQLQTYLKAKVNDKTDVRACIKKVKIEDSKKNNLLQLADMVCGAIAKDFPSPSGSVSYRSLIKSREGYVQFWPK
jgi:hypothetical protein